MQTAPVGKSTGWSMAPSSLNSSSGGSASSAGPGRSWACVWAAWQGLMGTSVETPAHPSLAFLSSFTAMLPAPKGVVALSGGDSGSRFLTTQGPISRGVLEKPLLCSVARCGLVTPLCSFFLGLSALRPTSSPLHSDSVGQSFPVLALHANQLGNFCKF